MFGRRRRLVAELRQALADANRVIGQMAEAATEVDEYTASVERELCERAGQLQRAIDILARQVRFPAEATSGSTECIACPHGRGLHDAWGCNHISGCRCTVPVLRLSKPVTPAAMADAATVGMS